MGGGGAVVFEILFSGLMLVETGIPFTAGFREREREREIFSRWQTRIRNRNHLRHSLALLTTRPRHISKLLNYCQNAV